VKGRGRGWGVKFFSALFPNCLSKSHDKIELKDKYLLLFFLVNKIHKCPQIFTEITMFFRDD